jgi:putative component of membrane protein insertase Oxa1/YidC/SpoIIIJ protein YidD
MSSFNVLIKLYKFLSGIIRPLLGVKGVCIYYPITCREYALSVFSTQPLYKALPKVFLRVLSCNPVGFLVISFVRLVRMPCCQVKNNVKL